MCQLLLYFTRTSLPTSQSSTGSLSLSVKLTNLGLLFSIIVRYSLDIEHSCPKRSSSSRLNTDTPLFTAPSQSNLYMSKIKTILLVIAYNNNNG